MKWPGWKSPSADVSETPAGFQVRIPVVRSWFGIAFLPVWLTGWALGWGFTAYGLVRANSDIPALFAIPWLIMWTAAGAMAFSWWMWLVSGREVVIMDGVRLQMRREVRGFARERRYDLARVHNLRFSPPVSPANGMSQAFPLLTFDGSIAFDVDGDDTKRFGMYLDEDRSLALVRIIRERFPSIQ
jgi:hypothetical protein